MKKLTPAAAPVLSRRSKWDDEEDDEEVAVSRRNWNTRDTISNEIGRLGAFR